MTRLTRAERQRIWEATYAAAFVDQFRSSYDTLSAYPNLLAGRNHFDVAIECCAEAASTVADAAVAQLAQWRQDAQS